jgi:hypothetical protein
VVLYPEQLVQRCRAETNRSRINLVSVEMSSALGDTSGGGVDTFKRTVGKLSWPVEQMLTEAKAVQQQSCPQLYHSQVAS